MSEILFPPPVRDCDGFDVPLSVFNGASRKELRARVLAPGVDNDCPFVVEKNGESLVLVGFTPFGTKCFTLQRSGDEVEVENLVGPALPVSPKNVMSDVLAMSLPSSCATSPEAVSTASYEGWTVDDTCHAGRPQLRHFRRTGGKEGVTPELEIEIEYRENEIVVRQKKCNYIARYVLQTVALPAVTTPAGQTAGTVTTAPAAAAPAPASATAPATPAAPAAGKPAAPAAPAPTPQKPAAAAPAKAQDVETSAAQSSPSAPAAASPAPAPAAPNASPKPE